MKILINTASTYKGGGVQVAKSFIEECKKYTEHEYHVILGKMLSELVNDLHFPENFTFYNIGYRPATRIFSLKSREGFFRELEKKVKPDVVFTTSGPAYWKPHAPHLVGYNLPHYIYRDSPFFSQIPLLKKIKWSLKGIVLKFFFKRDADTYVVQTDDVNQRLCKWIQTKKVYTVSNTSNHHYNNPIKADNKLPEKKRDEYRFLTLSAWYPHKNINIISKVICELPERLKHRVRFILTLPDEVFRDNFPEETKEHIINVGPVKPKEGPALYSECDALFLPTLLECFSASYAEAMKMEKPILTSDLDFAHTVCGEAALYADPMNPQEISKKIVELLERPSLQEKLVQEGIKQLNTLPTATQRAEEYLMILKKMVNAGKN